MATGSLLGAETRRLDERRRRGQPACSSCSTTTASASTLCTSSHTCRSAGDGCASDRESGFIELLCIEPSSGRVRSRCRNRPWAAVLPLVGKLKKFYLFSLKLAHPRSNLEAEQALARQFAEILHFTLRFDGTQDEGNDVNNELANRMSLFYANSTPMLKTLSDGTIKFVSDNPDVPIENTTDCLSTMACVCKVMLETPEYRSRFASDETILFCLRVMVGVIILYDYVHPAGAFVKTSGIDMKGCIRVLKEQPASSVEELLNALRNLEHISMSSSQTRGVFTK
ncbi:hypothetical protein CRUP_025925 [Coryphaenoides rupestris]|nr:hypothetical protein CRUP_025925 [Coryphaenoides rupestris]